MIDMDLDQSLPTIRSLAKRKATMFACRYKSGFGESEDVESHLLLLFLRRWRHFDAARASVQTFASRLMDKQLLSILRHGLAQKRQVTYFPVLSMSLKPGIHHFRIDIQRELPETIRETVIALACIPLSMPQWF